MSASPQPAAAWYPDPLIAGQLRWWDGSCWTDHVHVTDQSTNTPIHPVERLRDDSQWTIYPARTAEYESTILGSDALHLHVSQQRSLGRLFAIGLVATFLVVSFLWVIVVPIGIVYLIKRHRSGPSVDIVQVLVDEQEAFCRERGLIAIGDPCMRRDQRPSIAPEELDSLRRELESTGYWHPERVGPGVRGQLWRAAGDAQLFELKLTRGESSAQALVLRARLSGAVAARFPGTRLTFSSSLDHRTSFVSPPRTWKELQLERHSAALGYRAHVAPGQDLVAAMELLDPTFLVRLAEQAADLRAIGVVVTLVGGNLILTVPSTATLTTMFHHRHRVRTGKSSFVANAGIEPLVDTIVQVASDLHRRVEHEYL